MSSRFHMRSLIKSKHKQLSKNIKEKKFYRMKNNKYLDCSFTESNNTNQIQSIDNRIKNSIAQTVWGVWWLSAQMLHFHLLLSFFSVEKFLLRKKRQIKRQIIKKRQIKKNQKITWKTTNISIVHLQNRSIPIKCYLSLIKSKNRLHRQCEAYDDYQLKYPTYHSLKS